MFKKLVLPGGCSLLAILLFLGCGQSWSGKELETEKTAVSLVKEVQQGGYQIVPTPEMKAWIDQKKEMLIVDTMPYEASYRKNHIPGAVQYEFPIPEVKELDEAAKSQV